MSFLESDSLLAIFAQNPPRYAPLIQLIENIMRGESNFSFAQRELIAAYVSILNSCQYCVDSHLAIANHLEQIDPTLLQALQQDLATANLDDNLRNIFALVQKLTLTPHQISPADLNEILSDGWSARDIQDVIEVCALFNFINRLVDGNGLQTPTLSQLTAMAQGISAYGYQASFDLDLDPEADDF